jgi:hypothetical protein
VPPPPPPPMDLDLEAGPAGSGDAADRPGTSGGDGGGGGSGGSGGRMAAFRLFSGRDAARPSDELGGVPACVLPGEASSNGLVSASPGGAATSVPAGMPAGAEPAAAGAAAALPSPGGGGAVEAVPPLWPPGYGPAPPAPAADVGEPSDGVCVRLSVFNGRVLLFLRSRRRRHGSPQRRPPVSYTGMVGASYTGMVGAAGGSGGLAREASEGSAGGQVVEASGAWAAGGGGGGGAGGVAAFAGGDEPPVLVACGDSHTLCLCGETRCVWMGARPGRGGGYVGAHGAVWALGGAHVVCAAVRCPGCRRAAAVPRLVHCASIVAALLFGTVCAAHTDLSVTRRAPAVTP